MKDEMAMYKGAQRALWSLFVELKKRKRPFTTCSVSSSWIKISQSFDGESLRCTGLHPIQIVRRRMTADHQL